MIVTNSRLCRTFVLLVALSIFVVLAVARPAAALTINLNYAADATFTSAGLTAGDITNMKAAAGYAASLLTSSFNDPINVNIDVTAVAGTGTLGQSNTFLSGVSYATIRNATVADATTADDNTSVGAGGSVAAADPVGGSHQWWVTTAQAKALGITADNLITDGTFTFGGGFSYTYDPNNRAVGGKFDFIGIALHEFTEIMGRIGLMGNLSLSNGYIQSDLFHYTAAATRGLSNGAGRSFSIDAGTTLLKAYNNASANGGDLQDWASGTNDAFNAFSNSGVLNALSAVDLRQMDVIGYNFVPEPSTYVLMAMAAVGLLSFRGRRRA